MSRLARAADVSRTAHSCTRNANTVHANPRYSSPHHCPASARRTAESRPAGAASAKPTAHTHDCTRVSVSVRTGRPRVSAPLAVTCSARTSAAASISPSPADGTRRPSADTSRATPTSATTTATKNPRGSQRRDAAPSSSGVSTTVRLISRPALVALVRVTPAVSSRRTAAWLPPSRSPRPSSARVARCCRASRQTTVMASAAIANRSARTGSTPRATAVCCAAR